MVKKLWQNIMLAILLQVTSKYMCVTMQLVWRCVIKETIVITTVILYRWTGSNIDRTSSVCQKYPKGANTFTNDLT